MLKFDKIKRIIKCDLEEVSLIIKPIKFCNLPDFVTLFEDLMIAQIEAHFSLGKLLSNKNNYQLMSEICTLIPTATGELNIEFFEGRTDYLGELFLGISKDKNLSLSQAYWHHLNPDSKGLLESLNKSAIKDTDFLKELVKRSEVPNLSDSFEAPLVCQLNDLNWFYSLIDGVKKIAEKEVQPSLST